MCDLMNSCIYLIPAYNKMVSKIFLFMLLMFSKTKGDYNIACKDKIHDPSKIYFGVLLPYNKKYLASYEKVAPAITLGKREIEKRGLLPGLDIEVKYIDTKCDSAYGTWEATKFYFESPTPLHVILGPACDYVIAPIARLLKFMNVPLITAGALADDFGRENRRKNSSEYYMLVKTGWSFIGMANTLDIMLDRYKWRKIMFLYERDGRLDVTKYRYCALALTAAYDRIVHGKNCSIMQHKIADNFTTDAAREIVKNKIGVNYASKCFFFLYL